MLSVAAFLTNLPGGKATYSHSILSEQLLQSEHQSEVGSISDFLSRTCSRALLF